MFLQNERTRRVSAQVSYKNFIARSRSRGPFPQSFSFFVLLDFIRDYVIILCTTDILFSRLGGMHFFAVGLRSVFARERKIHLLICIVNLRGAP